MSTAVTFDPFNGLRLFEDAVTRAVAHTMSEPHGNRPWSLSVDVYESEDSLTVKADLPEVKVEDIDIRVENQTLTLRGERKFEKDEHLTGYHRIERSYGEFVRSFAVPSTVDTDKVQADYKNGVLTITLPKKEAAKPRQVKVAVHDSEAKVQ